MDFLLVLLERILVWLYLNEFTLILPGRFIVLPEWICLWFYLNGSIDGFTWMDLLMVLPEWSRLWFYLNGFVCSFTWMHSLAVLPECIHLSFYLNACTYGFTWMDSLMVFEISCRGEHLVTLVTGKWLLPRMDPHMYLEPLGGVESLITHLTCIISGSPETEMASQCKKI